MIEKFSRRAIPGTDCSSDPKRELQFSSVSGLKGFEAIAADWRTIVPDGGGHRFFHRPEWFRCLITLLDPAKSEIHFFTARRGTDLVAVLPLCFVSRRLGGAVIRILSLVRHDHVSLCDFVVKTGEDGPSLIQAFCRWLRERAALPWDVLDLSRVPERTAIASAFAVARESRVLAVDVGTSSYIPAAGNFEEVLSDVSGSFRRNLRRLARRAEESAPLTYQVVSDSAELADAVKVFLRVEASGWKGTDGTGSAIVCDPVLVDFYGCLAKTFGATGECAINLLRHGDRTVAAQFCLRVNGTVSILKIGYDEEAAAIAPGNLNMERTIRLAAETPSVHELSFVTSPPWGHLWKPRQELVRSYAVFNGTVRGRLMYGATCLKRGLDAWRRSAASVPGKLRNRERTEVENK